MLRRKRVQVRIFKNLVVQVLTAKLCGKQAQKKLRKITIMHSNVDAIQVERSYWDESGEHVVHPAAVRKKIPLRKKIREKKKKGQSSGHGRSRNGNNNENRRSSQGQLSQGQAASSSSTAGKENKGPRYGTLWKKKRSER